MCNCARSKMKWNKIPFDGSNRLHAMTMTRAMKDQLWRKLGERAKEEIIIE